MAIHTRIGSGCSDFGDASGYFLPRATEEDSSIEKCPFWLLLARVIGSKIEFIAIPGYAGSELKFFLRTELVLPEGCDVTNIAFYGDDGHSSLSPNLNENAEVKEGRQAVGFVVKCTSSLSQDVREELWVIPYNDLLFMKCDFRINSKNEALLRGTDPNEEACAVPICIDDTARDDGAIFPKRELLPPLYCMICTTLSFANFRCPNQTGRTVSGHQGQQRAHLGLCGSRGTGGVVSFGTSIALNILDLEEDEECSGEIDVDE